MAVSQLPLGEGREGTGEGGKGGMSKRERIGLKRYCLTALIYILSYSSSYFILFLVLDPSLYVRGKKYQPWMRD